MLYLSCCAEGALLSLHQRSISAKYFFVAGVLWLLSAAFLSFRLRRVRPSSQPVPFWFFPLHDRAFTALFLIALPLPCFLEYAPAFPSLPMSSGRSALCSVPIFFFPILTARSASRAVHSRIRHSALPQASSHPSIRPQPVHILHIQGSEHHGRTQLQPPPTVSQIGHRWVHHQNTETLC